MALPNVPNLPGAPPLPRAPGLSAGGAAVTLLVADVLSALSSALFGPQWGIFKDGIAVVIADSVITVDYKQDWTIATFPVEQGGFESYDKVSNPFDVRVRVASGGFEVARQALLESIEAVANSLDLFD